MFLWEEWVCAKVACTQHLCSSEGCPFCSSDFLTLQNMQMPIDPMPLRFRPIKHKETHGCMSISLRQCCPSPRRRYRPRTVSRVSPDIRVNPGRKEKKKKHHPAVLAWIGLHEPSGYPCSAPCKSAECPQRSARRPRSSCRR